MKLRYCDGASFTGDSENKVGCQQTINEKNFWDA